MSTSVTVPANTSIIALNTTSAIKKVMLPPVVSNPGRVLIIKDMYGTAYNNFLYISTSSSIDFIEKGSTISNFISYNYAAVTLTNDGINTWFYINQYYNTLSTQSRNVLLPFGFAATAAFVGTTFSASWTPSIGAVSYSVSYYYINTPINSGGTLIQTVSNITNLFNTITTTPNISYYYYVSVSAVNANGNFTSVSNTVQPIVFPTVPINATLFQSGSNLYCYWTAQPYTLSYNVIFYQTSTQVTTGGTIIQSVSGITTPYYLTTVSIIANYYYYAVITAVNNSALSSRITSPSVLVNIGPPTIPTSLSISRISDGTTTVSWNPLQAQYQL